MQFRRVLVLAAHPDDEMGCAGTIRRLADGGAEVSLVTFSMCWDLNGPELIREWMDATDMIGVGDPDILRLPNRSLHEHRRTILDVLASQLVHSCSSMHLLSSRAASWP